METENIKFPLPSKKKKGIWERKKRGVCVGGAGGCGGGGEQKNADTDKEIDIFACTVEQKALCRLCCQRQCLCC